MQPKASTIQSQEDLQASHLWDEDSHSLLPPLALRNGCSLPGAPFNLHFFRPSLNCHAFEHCLPLHCQHPCSPHSSWSSDCTVSEVSTVLLSLCTFSFTAAFSHSPYPVKAFALALGAYCRNPRAPWPCSLQCGYCPLLVKPVCCLSSSPAHLPCHGSATCFPFAPTAACLTTISELFTQQELILLCTLARGPQKPLQALILKLILSQSYKQKTRSRSHSRVM